MKNKQSFDLFIRNNGPTDGIYSDFSSSNLFLEATSPIRHFTNWDNGLTSLEKTNINNIQGFGSNNYLNIKNKVSDIKTIDNLAFVAYGNYTDINKSIQTINVTAKAYYYIRTNIFYDLVQTEYTTDGRIYLPNLNLAGILYDYNMGPNQFYETFPSVTYDLSNLFLRIKYNSISHNLPPSVPISQLKFSELINRYQIISPDNLMIDESGNYYDDPHYDKYKFLSFLPNLSFPYNTNELLQYNAGPSLNSGFSEAIIDINLDISIIKYTPVYNCGKVDVMTVKTGKSTQVSSDGRIVSIDHKLNDGDILKLTDSKFPSLQEIKYVQCTNSNSFIIYDDENFIKKTDVSGISNINLIWSCIGNVYGGDLGRWKYKTSIFSPDGRNRYGAYTENNTVNIASPVTTGFINDNLISSEFNDINSFNLLFEKDYNISLSDASLPPYVNRKNDNKTNDLNINNGLIKVRPSNMQSALDDWRLGLSSFLTNFRFGCSIDVKKYNNEYYLIVGERGPQTCLHLDKINLPINPLCGQAYLFKINSELNIEHLDTYKATKSDTSIAECPLSANYYYGPEKLFIYQPDGIDSILDGATGNYLRRIEYKQDFEYWYSAMCLHMYDPWNTNQQNIPGYYNFNVLDMSIADYFSYYNANSVRTQYFSGSAVEYGINRFVSYDFANIRYYIGNGPLKYNFLYPAPYSSPTKLSYYPYVDSFGKSVAIDFIDSDMFIFCSSKNKPYVIRPELSLLISSPTVDPALNYTGSDSQIASTSSGYIHVYKNGVKIQKIHEDGIKTPTKLFGPQSDRAEKFAKTLYAKNGQLIFGFSKPFDNTILNNDISKILFYRYNGSSYIRDGVVNNRNNRNIQIYNPKKISIPDHKLHILNQNFASPLINNSLSTNYSPSDNFGDYFIYDDGLLIANAYDIENEYGKVNTAQTAITIDSTQDQYFQSLNYVDQLFIYDNYEYKGRIVPKIDSSESQYSLSSLSPLYGNSLRSFYDDPDILALDLNLWGSYVVYGDRLIFRDPLSLNIYNKTASTKLNEYFTSIFRKKISPMPNNASGRFQGLNSSISILKPITPNPALNDDRNGIINGVYTQALDIVSVDDNAYLYNIHDPESLSLFIKNDNDNPALNLFLKTIEYSTSNLNLAISGSSPGAINLYMLGDAFKPNNNAESLYIAGHLTSSNNAELFMNNEPAGYASLFIQSDLPQLNNTNINLNIYGSILESIFNDSISQLYINGTINSQSNNSTSLFINTASGNLENATSLYISHNLYNISEAIPLMISGSITGNKYIDGGSILFIRSITENDNIAPLFIKQSGIVGDITESFQAMYIHNQEVLASNTLFVKAANLHDLGITIYMADGRLMNDDNLNCFIRGYLE